MSPIAITLAVVAFFIADEGGALYKNVVSLAVKSSDRGNLRARLAELGKGGDIHYENFRIFQLTITLAAVALIVILALFDLLSLSLSLLFILIFPIAILLITDRALTKRVARKRIAIEAEFPAIIEMLALAIGAGDSPVTAMSRIARRADGFLAADFREVVAQVERGVPFHFALDQMSRKLSSVTLRRFVDSMIISITRGAPLLEALIHGAQEARNSERVSLLDKAGKSEIAMMIPVVFLILPISILFALFPSLASLELFNY